MYSEYILKEKNKTKTAYALLVCGVEGWDIPHQCRASAHVINVKKK